MKFKELPSAEKLWELFEYDPLRGELIRRESPSRNVKAGSIAGCVNKRGYRNIKVDWKVYQAHRLIWKWHYGTDPQGELDHRNQEGLPIKQNHIWYLRELTGREHRTITRAHYKKSNLPVGVILDNNRYQARIKQDGKKVHLGCFDTPEEAHQTYLEALEVIESGGKVVSGSKPQTSRYSGVSWSKSSQKWVAYHTVDGKSQYLGHFPTEIEAHQTVCKARSVS